MMGGVSLQADGDHYLLLPSSSDPPTADWTRVEASAHSVEGLLGSMARERANVQGLCDVTGVDPGDLRAQERLLAQVPALASRVALGDMALFVRGAQTPDSEENEAAAAVPLAELVGD